MKEGATIAEIGGTNPVILGYILSSEDGLVIHYDFFPSGRIKDIMDVDLVGGAISAISTFTIATLGEPLEEFRTAGFKMVVVSQGNLILSLIAKMELGIAKGLGKKYVKLFEAALVEVSLHNKQSSSDMIQPIVEELAEEIKRLNEEASRSSYI